MMSRRTLMLLGVMVALLATLAGWSSYRVRVLQSAVQEQAQLTAECRRLIDQITWLSQQPNQAGAGEVQLHELTAVIEKAADRAGIDRQQLVRVWPEQSRRAGDSPYLQVPTQVLIRAASLEQLSRFLLDLEGSSLGLRVTSLRLTAPHEQETSELWTLETTISYLIYAPTTQRASAGRQAHNGDDAT